MLVGWCVDESVDQLTVGPWPTTGSTSVKCPAAPLPRVDNLTIDNMDDLSSVDVTTNNSVSLMSKTLIDFLVTR